MTARSGSTAVLEGRSAVASMELERELLARLGLTVNANAQDVETAHDELIAFLEAAPHDLRGWARRQIAIADESYALLCDPTTFATGMTVGALHEPPPPPPPSPLEATQPVAPETGGAAAVAIRVGASSPAGASTGRSSVRRILVAAGAVVAIATVVFAVYTAGAPAVPGVTGTPAPEASEQATLDSARVGQLMQDIQADPTDVDSLQALGDLYFQAGDYATAADWEAKVLALEPKNITALLGLGAANFNQGNVIEAEKQWLAVLAIDPYNLEAHYDLGFMYFSQDPPDLERTRAEWNSVIEIAPDSDIAKTVATHLRTLENWAASASPAGSPSAAPSADGAAGPAPSAGNTPSPSSVAP